MDLPPKLDATQAEIDAAVRVAGGLPPVERASAEDEAPPPSGTRSRSELGQTLPTDTPVIAERVFSVVAAHRAPSEPRYDRPPAESPPPLENASAPNVGGSQRKPRGFAAMSPETRRAIASKGGRAAQSTGRAHQFTSEEASAAGRKGGTAPHRSRGGRSKETQP